MKDKVTLSLILLFVGIVLGTILMASGSFVLKKENEELKIKKWQTGATLVWVI